LNAALNKYQINTPARIRNFLAQTAHETDLGRILVEHTNGKAYDMNTRVGRVLGNNQPGDG